MEQLGHFASDDRSEAGDRKAAEYVESLLGELHEIAQASNLSHLAYLLEIARLEAHLAAEDTGAVDETDVSPV